MTDALFAARRAKAILGIAPPAVVTPTFISGDA